MDFEEELKNIGDMERLHRKISLDLLHPFEYYTLLDCYEKSISIMKLAMDNEILIDMNYNDMIKNLENYYQKTMEIFDFEELSKHSLSDISGSFFKKGIFKEIDLQEELDFNNNLLLN